MTLSGLDRGLARRAALRWLLLTAAVAGVGAVLTPSLAGPDPSGAGFEAALARLCAAALLVSLGWLWVVATVVAVDASRGRVRARRGVPVGLQRLLLGACGLALAGGVASTPAHAGPPETHHPHQGIAGLPVTPAALEGAGVVAVGRLQLILERHRSLRFCWGRTAL